MEEAAAEAEEWPGADLAGRPLAAGEAAEGVPNAADAGASQSSPAPHPADITVVKGPRTSLTTVAAAHEVAEDFVHELFRGDMDATALQTSTKLGSVADTGTPQSSPALECDMPTAYLQEAVSSLALRAIAISDRTLESASSVRSAPRTVEEVLLAGATPLRRRPGSSPHVRRKPSRTMEQEESKQAAMHLERSAWRRQSFPPSGDEAPQRVEGPLKLPPLQVREHPKTTAVVGPGLVETAVEAPSAKAEDAKARAKADSAATTTAADVVPERPVRPQRLGVLRPRTSAPSGPSAAALELREAYKGLEALRSGSTTMRAAAPTAPRHPRGGAAYGRLRRGGVDWSDKATVMKAVSRDGLSLRYAPPALRAERHLALEAVRKDGRALLYTSPELRSDKEVVLEAVRQNGMALTLAPASIASDREVILAAVSQEYTALQDMTSQVSMADRQVTDLAVRAWRPRSLLRPRAGGFEVGRLDPACP